MRVRAVLLAIAVVLACGGARFGTPLPTIRGPSAVYDGGREDLAKKAHMSPVAVLRERAIGPFIALGESGSMAAYVAGAPSGALSREIVVVPLDKAGAPKVQASAVAHTAPDTSTLVVRRVDAGYVLAWTSLTDRGDSLSVLGVNDKGEGFAQPIEVERTPDHIVWVEIVPTSHGAVCIWAEEPPTGSANVLAQALDGIGKPRGVPSRALRNASSWQALSSHDGVALAIVQSGVLSLARLDAEGRLVGEPLPVSKSVGADMDMVRAGQAILFGWTDRTRVDPQLVLAGVDAQNKLIPPHDALPSEGSSALLALASGDAGALVAWEPAHKRERLQRRVQLGTVTDPASFVSKTTLDLAGGAAIEARSEGTGWALLASARVCPLDAGSACSLPAPVYTRLDASLGVVQTEALVNGPPISLAWGMDCVATRCLVLAAGPEAPTTVYTVDLSERPSTHASLVAPALPEDAPRLVSTNTLLTGSAVTDVASVSLGDSSLVASMVGAGVDDKTHEERLALRITVVAGGKVLETTTLAPKALATGGVTMASGPSAKEAMVAYVAKDGAAAHVHVARVDEHGARKSDVVLPGGSKGDASDVSIARVPTGYVVAWVDTRDGNGEVYACKLTGDVVGPEMRITNAPGDATDTTLAVTAGSVVLAWADPRESPHDGFADIYAVALSSRDAKPLGKEARVLSTAAHSRSPVLARTSSGVALAWIEEAPAGGASEEAKGAMFALLDEHARPVRDPVKLKLADPGTITAITLDDDPLSHLLHAVAARTLADELWLDAVRIPLDAGGSVESYALLVLDGPSSMDEALSLRADELVYSDEGGPGDARAKRAVVAWRK